MITWKNTIHCVFVLAAVHASTAQGDFTFAAVDDAFIKDFDRDGNPDALNVLYDTTPPSYDHTAVHVHNNNPNPEVGESRGIVEFTNIVFPPEFQQAYLEVFVTQGPSNFRLLAIPADGQVSLTDYGSLGTEVLQLSGSFTSTTVSLNVTDFVTPGVNAFRFEAATTTEAGIVFAAIESVGWHEPRLTLVVPEPSSVAGMGVLAVVATLARRRGCRISQGLQ